MSSLATAPRRRLLLIALVLPLLMLVVGRAAASWQDVEVRAEASTTEPIVGDRVTIEFVVEGAEDASLEAPDLRSLAPLRFLSGPSTMQENSLTSINGQARMLVRKRWTYTLEAREPGKARIESARVTIGARTFESQPIEIEVKPVPKSEGTGGAIWARTEDAGINKQLEGRYFALVEFPEKVFEQQVFAVETYVYRDPSLPLPLQIEAQNPDPGANFVVVGDTMQAVDATRLQWQQVEWNGRRMQRAVVNRTWYIATRTGRLSMESPAQSLIFPLQNSRRDPMDDFGVFSMMTQRSIRASLPTRPVELDVAALPSQDPGTTARLVGSNVRISAEVDRTTLSQHEFVTLRVRFGGDGNFATMNVPTLPDVAGALLSDTSAKGGQNQRTNSYNSWREAQYVLQAREAGTLRIPSMSFSVFDPKTGESRVESTPVFEVAVAPSTSASIPVAVATPVAEGAGNDASPRRIARDVAFIDRSELSPSDPRFAGRPIFLEAWFWIAQAAAPVVALIGGVLLHRVRTRDTSSVGYLAGQWRREAGRALRDARAKLDGSTRDDFYSTLRHGMMAHAASLLRRPPSGLTLDEAIAGMREHGIAADALAKFGDVIRSADAIRYSPAPDSGDQRRRDLDAAEAALGALAQSPAEAAR